MTSKWTEKDVLEYASALKSPFEDTKQGEMTRSNLAEKIRQMISRRKV